jgi:hypothetical protein
VELAEVIRAVGAEACARLAPLPAQKRTLEAILQCRTPALGGQVFACEVCGRMEYSYHSCGNRHCPKCHGPQTEEWLNKQRERLLPCGYYLLTFTLPSELRALAQARPKLLYGLLLKNAAATVQKLCADPKWLGAQPALFGVLHTWTRALLYHPHAHFLVSAGGLSPDGQQWLEPRHAAFFLPVHALSRIFQGKMRASLRSAGLLRELPPMLWSRRKKWVVHAQHAGQGEKVLEYLGRYVFRVAISNSRLEALRENQVTFRYREARSQQLKRLTLPAADFLRRFLQHVLPPGLPKVRHYGLDGSACKTRREKALALLRARKRPSPEAARPLVETESDLSKPAPRNCPDCPNGRLICVGTVPRRKKIPP